VWTHCPKNQHFIFGTRLTDRTHGVRSSRNENGRAQLRTTRSSGGSVLQSGNKKVLVVAQVVKMNVAVGAIFFYLQPLGKESNNTCLNYLKCKIKMPKRCS